VPEAPIDEYRDPPPRQDEVRRASLSYASVQAETKSACVHRPAQVHFRAGVPAAPAAQVAARVGGLPANYHGCLLRTSPVPLHAAVRT